jgi:putative NADH-flavin reductase
MKIVVFGASGGTGIQVVEQALAAGHEVTAFVRTLAKITIQHPNLTLFQGDVMDTAAVDKAISGQDAVISALGPSRPPLPGMMECAAKNILEAMLSAGIKRLIWTSGAGVRDPQDQPKFMDRLMKRLLTLMAGEVLRDSTAGVDLIRSSELDWTIVRFPRLVDGPSRGEYRVGYLGKDSGIQLGRADAADFLVKELLEGKYIRQAPVVSY